MSHDPNAEAVRSGSEPTDKGNELHADLEAAWEAWIKGIEGIDERSRMLLRAAFEAGAAAARGTSAAAELGRKGGLKGGKARAEKLSAEQRREIARRAAKVRWGKGQK
jgi:hypothetical protein